MKSSTIKICILLLVLMCSMLIAAYKYADNSPSDPNWMQKYKTRTYYDSKDKDDRGLYRTQFVERQGRLGHQGMFESPRPPISGQRFLLETTIFGDAEQVDVFLLNEKGRKISKLRMLPRNEYSYTDYYSPGTFPSQPFFIAASVKFKDRSPTEKFIDPTKIIPRTDIDSFRFTFKPDVDSDKFKKVLPKKSQAEKVALFSEGNCEYGQMLAYALHQGAEGYTPPSSRADPNKKNEALPIPFFHIRHSLGMGVEPKGQCYLEVLQKKNQFEEMEFTTQDKHWTMKECKRFQDLLHNFGKKTRSGKVYAFQEASCVRTGERVNLKLRIGFSKKLDFQFSDKPKVARTPKPSTAQIPANQVRLKQLCVVKEGTLWDYQTPIDLSLERSGKAIVRVSGKDRSAIFRAPDCKIITRYRLADLASHTISPSGSGLYNNGLETSDGTDITLTPPENIDKNGGSEYPKLSLDGSAVIWRINKWQPDRKRYERIYLIQNLKGETLVELRGYSQIYMLDMKQKTFLTHLSHQGLAVFDFEGQRIGDLIDIPGVPLYFSYQPPFKLFNGNNNEINWVGWNNADFDEEKKTFIIWKTDFGRGQYNFEYGQEIDSVSVSGDGRYIAAAYRTRPDSMSRRQDYLFILLSTESGQRVYTKNLGTARSSGGLINQVAFLKNKYVAINRLVQENMFVNPEAVELFEIQE